MIARRLLKPEVQGMLRALRAAGLTVNRDSLGAYRCDLEGQNLFTALPGRGDYLVRMRADLFV